MSEDRKFEMKACSQVQLNALANKDFDWIRTLSLVFGYQDGNILQQNQIAYPGRSEPSQHKTIR